MKRILCAIAAMLMVMTFAPESRADDVPYGYSTVSDTPQKGETARWKTLNDPAMMQVLIS